MSVEFPFTVKKFTLTKNFRLHQSASNVNASLEQIVHSEHQKKFAETLFVIGEGRSFDGCEVVQEIPSF